MTVPEEEIVMISAIEHYSYCPRQCGLIHLEQVFDENLFTLRGQRAHARAHAPSCQMEGGVRVERALPVWSDRLGLSGVADVVEFHADGTIYPVEQKLGKRRGNRHDALQLCAQALCLEEMLGIRIPAGALFYGETRHRTDVAFDTELRDTTERAASRLHQLIASGVTPRARREPKCDGCSLIELCMPEPPAGRSSAARYLEQALQTQSFSPDLSRQRSLE
jgi:CRISPR-associated exonuclease Cas4